MECYSYSVLTRWFSSVYSGAGSRPSSDLMAKHPDGGRYSHPDHAHWQRGEPGVSGSAFGGVRQAPARSGVQAGTRLDEDGAGGGPADSEEWTLPAQRDMRLFRI